MSKVLNAVKILKCRACCTPQQLRDVFKMPSNFSTKSNSSPIGHIPPPKSYTFQQNQKKNTGNITSYGWIMLVRKSLILRHFVIHIQHLQAIPLTTFGLGCWQVQRKRWKEQLIDELHVQTNSLPIDLPEE